MLSSSTEDEVLCFCLQVLYLHLFSVQRWPRVPEPASSHLVSLSLLQIEVKLEQLFIKGSILKSEDY